MHLTRSEITKKVPIARKGTIYIARPLSHVKLSVSALSAVRDMLKLAKNAREVKEMIKNKALKINGRVVRDAREPICLLNLFEADKKYKLIILETGRFSLEETKEDKRIIKIVNKKMLKGKMIQLNGHDGTNILSKDKVSIGDSIEIDGSNKIFKVLSMEKGRKVLIESGRNRGRVGSVVGILDGKAKVKINGEEAMLDKSNIIAL